MDRAEIIRVLKEMADLLELADASAFEVMAHRNASRTLEGFEGDIAASVAAGTLTDIDGIGKGLEKVITELVRDGESSDHRSLRARFPEHLPDLLTLSGIGPKKVKALWGELGIESLDALEAAAREGKVSTLRGFGKKTEERIIAAIERRRSGKKFAPSTRQRREGNPAAATPGSGMIFRGTSGYSYPGWKGTFYPEDLSASKLLPFYAERFPTVEINNTFYRFPTDRVLAQWSEQTPETFRFAVKANQRITHRSRLKDVGEVTASFVERCETLGDRLGPILFQLPPNLRRDDALLDGFLAILPDGGRRYAIEFRHESWFDDAVFSKLREHHVAFVVQDAEDVSAPRELTAEFTYVRLRRSEYDTSALDSWTAWFSTLRAASRDVYVYLKHDEDGSSPEPILGQLVGEEKAPVRRMAKSARTIAGKRRAKKKA